MTAGFPRAVPTAFDFLELRRNSLGMSCRTISTGFAVVADNEMHDPVFERLAICEIEIDPDTGDLKLTRYARSTMLAAINPLIVHGQTHGAAGRRSALVEQCVIDEECPSSLCGRSWTTACRVPTRCRSSPPRSSKCCRRPILSGSRPAARALRRRSVIISAVVDALSRYGVQDVRMPATPYKIWQLIQDAKAKSTESTTPTAKG